MRFTIQREAFLKPLRMVGSVVERKSTQMSPVLLNVLITVKGEDFSLTTTDQEVEIVAKGKLEDRDSNREDGAITVPARKLMDVCKALPEGAVISFIEEQAAGRMLVRAGRSRFTLSTLPASDFPGLSEAIGDFRFSIQKRKLKELIEKTCFAMAEQDVRYYLNGLLLEVKNGEVVAVAADGHRLAFGKIPLSLNDQKNIRVIAPRKGILELQRLLDDSDETIEIILGNNHIRAVTDEVQLTSKLLDGRFPDYERIIFTNGDKVVTGQRELLRESFQRAAALFSDRFRGVRLRLTEGCLRILASNTEQDEVEEDVEIDYKGPEMEIGFNVKYLIDFLTVIQTEVVKFTFSDANSSARVEGVGEAGSIGMDTQNPEQPQKQAAKNESGVYVIMPMRI